MYILGLHEERAVLLGCLGQHHQALAIYVHTLGDIDAALNYCNKNYSSSGSGSEVSIVAIFITCFRCWGSPSNSMLLVSKQYWWLGSIASDVLMLWWVMCVLWISMCKFALNIIVPNYFPFKVYLTLLKLLVTPSDVSSPSGSPVKQQTKPTDVKTVLDLLQNYLQCIDLSQVRLSSLVFENHSSSILENLISCCWLFKYYYIIYTFSRLWKCFQMMWDYSCWNHLFKPHSTWLPLPAGNNRSLVASHNLSNFRLVSM